LAEVVESVYEVADAPAVPTWLHDPPSVERSTLWPERAAEALPRVHDTVACESLTRVAFAPVGADGVLYVVDDSPEYAELAVELYARTRYL
jgi:hypothetical protein